MLSKSQKLLFVCVCILLSNSFPLSSNVVYRNPFVYYCIANENHSDFKVKMIFLLPVQIFPFFILGDTASLVVAPASLLNDSIS